MEKDIKLKEDESELDIDAVESSDLDERIILLAEFLECDPFMIEKSDWGKHNYNVIDGDHDGEKYSVLTDSEADEAQRESAESLLDDIGFKDCGLDIADYVDSDYCEETMRKYIEDDASSMSDDELIDELLANDVISLTDEEWFSLRDDVDTEDEDFDEDDIDNYELIKSRSDLEQAYIDYKEDDDLVQMFWDYGYGDGIEDEVDYYLRYHHTYPSWIDEDKAIDDLINYADRGQDLSTYDGSEEYLGKTDDGEGLYAYRLS